MKKIIVVTFFSLFLLVITGCDSNTQNSNSDVDDNSNTQTVDQTKYSLDNAFKFDGFEITVGSTIEFVTVNNEFSDYNNSTAIKVPVTVKNVSTETGSLNMFYYKFFGSQGVQVEELDSYFDDSVDYAGELRPNASYTKYFYFLYDGNGDYYINFDNYSEEIELKLTINKQ